MYDWYQRLNDRYRCGNNCKKLEERNAKDWKKQCLHQKSIWRMLVSLTDRPRCEVQQVQSGVEQFIEETHETQDRSVCVINMHYRILVHINELMRRFALQDCAVNRKQSSEFQANPMGLEKVLRVQVKPMARDINGHWQLKPEHVFRIEIAESHE